MAGLPIATPAQAQKIWESMTDPSTRRVATKLRQAGLPVSHMSVARWRNQGWRMVSGRSHPLEAAQTSLDDAVPLLTSDPNTTAKSFIEQEAAERAKLEQLTDNELLRRTAREAAIAGILIFRALQRQLKALFPMKIEELAVLIRSLTRSLEAVTAGFKQAKLMQDQTGNVSQADKRRQ